MEAVNEVNHLLLEHLETVQAAAAKADGLRDFRWSELTPRTVVTSSVGVVHLSKL